MKSFFRWINKSRNSRADAEAMWQLCRTEYKKDADWVYQNIMNGSSYEDIRRMTHGK